MGNNYKARRARGQCADCTKQSQSFRCDDCKVKLNARLREWKFNRSMNQEMGRRKQSQEVASCNFN